LRVLDLYPSSTLDGRLRLPHLMTQPLQRFELEGDGPAPSLVDPVLRISLGRLERYLGRDPRTGWTPDSRFAPTPRLFAFASEDDQRIEFSAGVEGAGERFDDRSRFVSGSGLHLRSALALDQWLVSTHFFAGQVDGARRFADPIVPGNDFIVHTEDTYLAYTAADGAWSGRFGRTRWHWGPGEEGSLLLSRTSPAMTGLSLRARLASIRLDVISLSATLDQAAGEQLAAHRIEWQPFDALRLGVTEAARYRSENWQPLYLVGVIPYVLVQRFQVQDAPDSVAGLRNNEQIAFDAGWRLAPGTRVYGEFLIDDLHARTNDNPNKLAWQVGWEGAGSIVGQRVTWGGEYTRVWRYVYTSFFGRAYALQQMPIGFPTGPDARRIRVRGTWDPGIDWQAFGIVTLTDKGENGLDEPYVPGTPKPAAGSFEGVVERTRDIEAGLRWWPAGGVDVSVSGGWRRVEDAGHVPGETRDGALGSIVVRLTR
jgi:Capsule assembly protein Wzi